LIGVLNFCVVSVLKVSNFLNMNFTRFIAIATVVACISTVGCGPDRAKRDGRAIVEGNVTFDGKPVTGGIIKFTSATGDTEEGMLRVEGNYYVENAPVGECKVSVDPEAVKPELGSRYVKLPPKYLKAETTDVTVKIEPGSNKFDIELK
jgi:hypothetical protein